MRLRDNPGFVRFWSAQTVSGFGTYVTTLAIQVLIVVTLHQGAAAVGLVNSARWLPYLLFGLVAGVLVDRARRRPVLIATDLGRGVLLAAIPALALSHSLSVPVLMAFMTLFGLMSLANDAAFQSYVPRLVPSRMLIPANAALDQSDAVAQTSGPAIAGALVSLMTAPWAVLVDAVSYVVCGLLLVGVRAPEPPSKALSVKGIRREAAEGLRWVYGHQMLRPLALTTHGWFVFSAFTGAVVTPFALGNLGLNPFGLGLALAAAGVGGLLGSLTATRLGRRFGSGRIIIAGRALTALAWALAALSTHDVTGWLLFGFGQLVLGVALGIEGSNEMGYRQSVTPDHLQGRMNATMRSVNRGMIVIAAPVGGFVAEVVGYRTMLWISAAGFMVVAVALGLSRFRGARAADTAREVALLAG